MDFATAFRDYETDGVPSSGAHEVKKSDVRAAALDLAVPLLTVQTIAGTTYTLLLTDMGNLLRFTSASAVSVTCPADLPEGFNVIIKQGGAGSVTLVAASGATLENEHDEFVTAEESAVIGVIVDANSDDASANYLVFGSTV